jgi:hypothetical protein
MRRRWRASSRRRASGACGIRRLVFAQMHVSAGLAALRRGMRKFKKTFATRQ